MNGIIVFFFNCYLCCILENKSIFYPDFSGENALSSSAPVFDEESVSLANTAPFHSPGL